MDKAVIKDTERGEELTLTELRTEYENQKKAGETEAETFEETSKTSRTATELASGFENKRGRKPPLNERKKKNA